MISNKPTIMKSTGIFLAVFALLIAGCAKKEKQCHVEDQPSLSGEVTGESVILQARLVEQDTIIDYYDVPGKRGYGAFQVSTDTNFKNTQTTNYMLADSSGDFIVKKKISSLAPNTTYYYRLIYGVDSNTTCTSDFSTFTTLPGKNIQKPTSFVMVTGSHHFKFLKGGQGGSLKKEFSGCSKKDSVLGFPAYASMLKLQPDFFIGNGDNVYYDHRPESEGPTKDVPGLRAHWHRLFSMPRLQNLLQTTPTYWLKDDHDYRYDDADTTDYRKGEYWPLPSHETGMKMFIEQVPITDPENKDDKTYRTYKLSKDLQIWMFEGRDYRSPNQMEDGPDKSIWGEKQEEWLKNTLKKSNAKFKLLVSPTPMIGPDGTYKVDNHTNIGGFRYERDEFFNWIKNNNLHNKGFYIICGDRHWQYHSILDSIEEFSCGALVDANSRMGVPPGSGSSDPEGEVNQVFTSPEPTGGFMLVKLEYPHDNPQLSFIFYDEEGNELYREIKK